MLDISCALFYFNDKNIAYSIMLLQYKVGNLIDCVIFYVFIVQVVSTQFLPVLKLAFMGRKLCVSIVNHYYFFCCILPQKSFGIRVYSEFTN